MTGDGDRRLADAARGRPAATVAAILAAIAAALRIVLEVRDLVA